MNRLTKILQQLKLRYLLFLLLLVAGIVPLAVSSYLVVRQNREILETQEKTHLTRSAQFLSFELNEHLLSAQRRLAQLGETLYVQAPEGELEDLLRQDWLQPAFRSLMGADPEAELAAVRLLNLDGQGPYAATVPQTPELVESLDATFSGAAEKRTASYRFLLLPGTGEPAAALAVPILSAEGNPTLFVQGVVRLRRMEAVLKQETRGDVQVFLVDRSGQLLWSGDAGQEEQLAITQSRLVRDFVQTPLNMTQEYTLDLGGKRQRMLGRVSPVEAPGWGIVVHRPADLVPAAVEQMVFHTLISSGILITLALVIAALATRKISRPIQELANTTHQIAAGKFDQRVEVMGPSLEIHDLATDFNRMSGHIQDHVDRLEAAAQANRELFIGSMRSFVAAIDAKDPYTRGHSERVAAYSRIIAKQIGLSDDDLHRIWVGALLHDVGKIGIEDRILRKSGVLTDEEYEQMKLHPVIGAQIMSRIEQLKAMIPAIRWHHEAWDGRGYPDKLRAEQIPLSARIVGVADTFDAITTNRPYQKAYEPDFAVETIIKLQGKRFDVAVVDAFHRAYQSGLIQKRPPSPTAVPHPVAKAVAAR
jgi:putative nucleotidyltransferase with HDIG domain